jgi:asparagine synthase (glutamine-hydrolysing)
MCGIAGCLAGSARQAEIGDQVRRMADALVHRGPDDGGVWVDSTAPFAVSHRRLAILDLTPAGHQPMLSSSGRYVIAFNGEIYNHLELRRELDCPAWRGHSDTETILAAIEAWGLKPALQKLVGMFAFALWDRERRELSLARDRVGEKPLYYGWQGDTFLFGSELKALAAHPAWCAKVDQGALTAFMRYGYVPLPHSIWCGIRKLLPGGFVVLPEGSAAGSLPTPEYYWRALSETTLERHIPADDNAAADELEQHLRIATAGQMVADVPLGAFLSGGVDSSLVVALMQAQSSRPVRTFSIGFSEGDFNEAVYAKAVARHLGTDHTELYLEPADALEVIPRLVQMYDEPFGDSSQIATHLVAALARRDVTVCLSGDGGDELFGGYNRYFWGRSIWQRIGPLPRTLRRMVAGVITAISPEVWDSVGRMAPARLHQKSFGDRLHKLAGVIDSADREELYRRLLSQQRDPEATVIGGVEPQIWADEEAFEFSARRPNCDFAERMMFQDLIGYMSDDILTKVDRAAMSVSLETRIPMLDHRVVEFAWSLPLHMKIRDGQGKWLLRQVLYRHVPKQLIERPKQGFGVPLASWLRGPLRDWAEALLDESRLRREGHLRPEPIRARWQEHLAGSRNWQYWLWNVLIFQAWRERWISGQ